MSPSCVCGRKVTPQMIRQGQVVVRGQDLVCRQCTGAKDALPRKTSTAGSAIRAGAARPQRAELASFGRRLASHLIDAIILNVIVVAAVLLFGLGAGLAGSTIGGILVALIPVAYCFWFWMRTGATPGKSILGLRIVGRDNRPPTATQALVRYLGYIPATIPLGLGFLWMLWDGEKRCWHDIFAGTRVVRG